MTPRGADFVLDVGIEDSTLAKLTHLESNGLLPIAAERRDCRLFVSLSSSTSTQRVAEVVGPSVAVTLGKPPQLEEEPPGTDWLVRLVGSQGILEESIGRLLPPLAEISDEIGHTDLVQMGLSGVKPTILDIRISTDGPTEFATRRTDLLEIGEKLGVAMLVQPLSLFKKPKGLVCFDLDSTLVSEELIIEVAKRVGKEGAVAEITERAMSGELNYERSFIHRVALLRGAREEDLEEIWRGMRPTKEVIELLDSLRMQGVRTAILSGAFTYFTERAMERLGIDFAVGNQIEIRDGLVTGNVLGQIVSSQVKLEKMRGFAAQLNLTLDQTVAIGDGANDMDIIREAGTGVAYNKGGVVKRCADAVLPDGQLGDLLHIVEA